MIFAIFAGFPTLVEFFGTLLCKTFFIRNEKENLVVFNLFKLKHVFLGQEIFIRGTRINMWLCPYVRPHFSALPRILHGFVIFPLASDRVNCKAGSDVLEESYSLLCFRSTCSLPCSMMLRSCLKMLARILRVF